MRVMLRCTVCGGMRPDAEVTAGGVSLGARCEWFECAGMYADAVQADVPRAVINAVIVRAMIDEAYSQQSADMFARFGDDHPYQWCDMLPAVYVAVPLDPEKHRGDRWYVEVQYSSRGGRAGYGVNRDHVPNCYVN